MACQSEKQARAEAMLGELAELGLMVAKDLAVRTRACEDADQAVALADAFQKVSRVVRLTLALDFKLDRDAAREARAETQEAEKAQAEREAAHAAPAPWPVAPAGARGPIEARKDRVSRLMNRLLWNEAEGDQEEFEVLEEDLSARLDEAARSADFETLPIETLARRVIADMGLSGHLALSLCEKPVPAAPVLEAPAPRLEDSVGPRPDG